MDLLNRAFTWIGLWLRSLSPRGRLTTALLLIAAAGSIAYLAQSAARPAQIQLLGGHKFSTGELHAAQVAFGKAGLKDFDIDQGQISIPRHQLDVYLAAMADANVLPADFGDYIVKTIREQSAWAGSRLHDQAIMAARERVLSNAISQMQGIDSAQVFISVLDKQNFRGERLATASVDVKTSVGRPLDQRQVRAIRSLVAGGTAGLKREQITVVDSTSGRDFPGGVELSTAELAEIERQEAQQQRYEEAILKLLAYVPGATVSVRVERNAAAVEAEAIAPLETAATQAPSGDSPTALAGAANTGAALDADSTGNSPSDAKSSTDDARDKDSLAQQPAERVTASITVPSGYIEGLLRKRYPRGLPAEAGDPLAALRDEVVAKIRQHVRSIIPQQGRLDPNELVTVTVFDQVADPALAAAPDARPHYPSPLPPRNALVAALLVVGAGLVWWTIHRMTAPGALTKSGNLSPASAAAKPLAANSGDAPGEDDAASGAHGPHFSPPRRREGASATLRDELAQSVRDDPDAAVNVLRNWIGNASSTP